MFQCSSLSENHDSDGHLNSIIKPTIFETIIKAIL